MYINPDSEIAGQPALAVRQFFRNIDSGCFTEGSIQAAFSVSQHEAKAILVEFQHSGFIERADSPKDEQWWETTIKGQGLAMASAAKPIHRKSADKILRGFVERVKQLNSDAPYAYKVSKVVLFGSYLQPQDRINDIDIAVLLAPVEQDRDKQRLLEEERVNTADRNFSSFISQLLWPRHEVRLFLKSRSRAISLHDYEVESPLLAELPTLTLFENGEWVQGY